MIIVYSKNNCPHCVTAKSLLEQNFVEFTEINIETNAAGRDYLLDKGLRSLPQVFAGEELIGGVDKLKVWLEIKDQTL